MIEKLYLLSAMLIPCLCYQFYMLSQYRHHEGFLYHMIWLHIFLLYLFFVFQVTGIAGSFHDIGLYGPIIRQDEINLILFQSKQTEPYILNMIMFMPLGFLLPYIWKKWRHFIYVFLTGLCFSLNIEFWQLFNLRCSDIDDVVMNTAGAVFGYLIWKIFHIFYKNKTVNFSTKWEPVIYLILATLGVVILYNGRLLILY